MSPHQNLNRGNIERTGRKSFLCNSQFTIQMFITTAEQSYSLAYRLQPHHSSQIYIYTKILCSDEQTWSPSQSLQVDTGVLVGLKEHAAILAQGSSGIDRQRERWEFLCSLNRLPNWENLFNKWGEWGEHQVTAVQIECRNSTWTQASFHWGKSHKWV